MGNDQHYRTLVRRYLDNTATAEELELFFELLAQEKLDNILAEESRVPAKAPVRRMRGSRLVVAASLFAVCCSVALLVFQVKHNHPASIAAAPDAKPGSHKAILTLGNGTTIALDDKMHQSITDGGADIRTQNQVLVYRVKHSATVSAPNIITTPKGGEYQLQLPDGSVVWLNAGTSLRYPTAFTGKERVVELDGEAYFEVAKNPQQPFIVKSQQGQVRVLGTHFNVRAYHDEAAMKTTLAEGAVVLQQGDHTEHLKPGESGVVTTSTNTIDVAKANVEQDLAWKNGWFYFDKTPLDEIMTQIGRWYDLEIRYDGAKPDKRFVGKINRNANLSEVLNILRLSDLRFRMEGKTLVVEG